jgi:hypothetical protein
MVAKGRFEVCFAAAGIAVVSPGVVVNGQNADRHAMKRYGRLCPGWGLNGSSLMAWRAVLW